MRRRALPLLALLLALPAAGQDTTTIYEAAGYGWAVPLRCTVRLVGSHALARRCADEWARETPCFAVGSKSVYDRVDELVNSPISIGHITDFDAAARRRLINAGLADTRLDYDYRLGVLAMSGCSPPGLKGGGGSGGGGGGALTSCESAGGAWNRPPVPDEVRRDARVIPDFPGLECCWRSQPAMVTHSCAAPPPPEMPCDGGQPDGACTPREEAAGTCPEDCSPPPPEPCGDGTIDFGECDCDADYCTADCGPREERCPAPPGRCEPPAELASRLAALEAAVAALLRAWEGWSSTPGPPSTGKLDTVLEGGP